MLMLRLSFSLVFFLASAFPADAANKVSAWQIDQNMQNWGNVRLIVCDRGALFSDLSRGYNVAMKAPQWRLVYFADSRRVIADVPLTSLVRGLTNRVRVFYGEDAKDKDPSNWKLTGGKVPICGLATVTYARLFKEENHKWVYNVARDIKPPYAVEKFLCEFYGIADFGNLPLRFRTGFLELNYMLDTKAAIKTSVDPAIFDAPKNYQKVRPEEVMFAVTDFP